MSLRNGPPSFHKNLSLKKPPLPEKKRTFIPPEKEGRKKTYSQKQNKKKSVPSAFDSRNISVKMISAKKLKRKLIDRSKMIEKIESLDEDELKYILRRLGISTSKYVTRTILVSLAKCAYL